MPGFYSITANFFVGLINRLGVRPPPPEAFVLSNVVNPVTIVDQDIQLAATMTPPIFAVPASAGEQIAPAANFILADTGALSSTDLATVNWSFQVLLMCVDAQTPRIVIEHRNAANAANIWSQTIYGTTLFAGGAGAFIDLVIAKTLQPSERLRVRVDLVGLAGSRYHANIFSKQLI
jgi:hypothetical protein